MSFTPGLCGTNLDRGIDRQTQNIPRTEALKRQINCLATPQFQQLLWYTTVQIDIVGRKGRCFFQLYSGGIKRNLGTPKHLDLCCLLRAPYMNQMLGKYFLWR